MNPARLKMINVSRSTVGTHTIRLLVQAVITFEGGITRRGAVTLLCVFTSTHHGAHGHSDGSRFCDVCVHRLEKPPVHVADVSRLPIRLRA